MDTFMPLKTRDLLTRSWQSQTNLALFLLLLILTTFVLPALGFEKNNLALYDRVAGTVVAIMGTAIAWGSRKLFLPTALMAIVAIAFRWATSWWPTHTLRLWSASTGLALVTIIVVVLLLQVFRPGPVTAMRIQGAIAAYLCLAFGWAHAYQTAALADPHAFYAAGTDISLSIHWVNYSFGMLTTIGYSGIAAADPVARTLCSAEAVTGQLYLAVLVARLVSMHVSAEEHLKQERSGSQPSNQRPPD